MLNNLTYAKNEFEADYVYYHSVSGPAGVKPNKLYKVDNTTDEAFLVNEKGQQCYCLSFFGQASYFKNS